MPSKCISVSCIILCGLSVIRCINSSIDCINTIIVNKRLVYGTDYDRQQGLKLLGQILEMDIQKAVSIADILLYLEAIFSVLGIMIYGFCLYGLIKKKKISLFRCWFSHFLTLWFWIHFIFICYHWLDYLFGLQWHLFVPFFIFVFYPLNY